jgi:hypothetical protein
VNTVPTIPDVFCITFEAEGNYQDVYYTEPQAEESIKYTKPHGARAEQYTRVNRPEATKSTIKMKCPFGDGWEGTPDEYLRHYDEKHSKPSIPLFPGTLWQTKVSEALAREIISKGHFDRRDEDNLIKKIEGMLKEYEKQWG